MSFMMGMTESPEGFDDEVRSCRVQRPKLVQQGRDADVQRICYQISDYEEAPAASGSNKRSRKSGAAAGPASKAKGKAAKKDNGTGSHNNDDNAASAECAVFTSPWCSSFADTDPLPPTARPRQGSCRTGQRNANSGSASFNMLKTSKLVWSSSRAQKTSSSKS